MPESGRTHIVKDMDSLEAIYGAPASTSLAKEIDYLPLPGFHRSLALRGAGDIGPRRAKKTMY
ncbi:MAG: hypothetical protein KAJ11_09995 [Alphaproteobacteria bacterium]|jgi:hypothetical protein|nr:hypothetical protein [Alphaproteobacteria bacterium]